MDKQSFESSGIPQATIDYILQESREYLDILHQSIDNLHLTIKEDTKQQEVYRSTFCLRGELAVLGYSSPIAAYGLDECLRELVEKPILIESTLIAYFSELLELLNQTLESARTGIAPTSKQYETLMLRSRQAIENLKKYLN
jgi:hypothetical protein